MPLTSVPKHRAACKLVPGCRAKEDTLRGSRRGCGMQRVLTLGECVYNTGWAEAAGGLAALTHYL